MRIFRRILMARHPLQLPLLVTAMRQLSSPQVLARLHASRCDFLSPVNTDKLFILCNGCCAGDVDPDIHFVLLRRHDGLLHDRLDVSGPQALTQVYFYKSVASNDVTRSPPLSTPVCHAWALISSTLRSSSCVMAALVWRALLNLGNT